MSNENEIAKLEHDFDLHLKKGAIYGWDGSQAVMLKTNSNGEVILDSTNLDARYVEVAGDTMTGDLNMSANIVMGSGRSITTAMNNNLTITPHGSGELSLTSTSGDINISTSSGTVNLTTSDNAGIDLSPHGTGRVTMGGGGVGVNGIIDDDTMATASDITLATSESIKAYVDSQSGGSQTLAETLTEGNVTGGTDLEVSDGDKIVSPAGSALTLESGATGEGTAPTTTTQSIPSMADPSVVSYWTFDDDGIFPEDTDDANLLAWYKFEDGSGSTLTDEQGNYDATLSGSYSWTGSGAFNASTDSVNFVEDAGSASMGNVTELSGASKATFQFWFNADKAQNGIAISRYDAGNELFYITPMHNDGHVYLVFRNTDSSGFRWNYGSEIQAGTWYMMTVVFDGTQTGDANRLKLYLNDEQKTLTALSAGVGSTLITSTNNVLIGDYGGTSTNGWDGDLDDIAIYTDARTDAEILRDYRKAQSTYVADYVGTNHGAITSATFNGSGAFEDITGDNSLDFDGTSDYVTIPNNTDLNFDSGGTDTAFSFSMRVNPDALTTNHGIIAKRSGSTSADRSYLVDVQSNGTIRCFLYTDGSNYIGRTTASGAIVTGQWQDLLITYDGSETAGGIKIYVDSIQVDTTNATGGSYTGMGTNTQDVSIGSYETTANEFNGKIDNVIIYNDERTPAEARTDYINGTPGGGQVLYYKFDTGSGSTAVDSSEKGNDGTITGATWNGSGYFGYTGDDSLSFDGTNNYVTPTSSVALTDDFTVYAWVNIDTFGRMLLSNSSDSDTYIYPDSATEWWIQPDAGGGANKFTVPTMSTGTWYFLAVTRINGTMRLYLNGTESSTGGLTETGTITLNQIGRYFSGSLYWDGLMDSVILHKYGKTSTEITADYDASVPSGVANIIDTTNAFSSESKILSVRNNGVEIGYFDGDGFLYNDAGERAVYTDGDTGGTGSAGAGKQYVEMNVNDTTYRILHDGSI